MSAPDKTWQPASVLDLEAMYGAPPNPTREALIYNLTVAVGMLHDIHSGYQWRELSEDYDGFVERVTLVLTRAGAPISLDAGDGKG